MDDAEQKVVIFAIATGVVLGCFLLFLFLIFLKQKNQSIRNKEQAELDYKKELIKTQVEIQSQTMKHIGREIHDNVGQKLTLSSLYLQQLVFENKAPQINENIKNVNEIINESLNELRHLSKYLTDDTINDNSISDLLAQECKKIDNLKECKVHFQSNLETRISSYQIKSVLLRVTQEFLQNSIKHSKCKNIEVSLSKKCENLQLILKDDGKGFNVKNLKTDGIGLKNMQKRIEMIQGLFQLESAQHKGTKLTLEIPDK